MPKCSGPTCWTRGWSTPRGLPTDMGTRRPEGRLREREVAMRQASKKMDRAHPIFAAGASERELFKTKPTYQGTHLISGRRKGTHLISSYIPLCLDRVCRLQLGNKRRKRIRLEQNSR